MACASQLCHVMFKYACIKNLPEYRIIYVRHCGVENYSNPNSASIIQYTVILLTMISLKCFVQCPWITAEIGVKD